MYEIIGTRASRALRVLWLAEELALSYTHIPAAPRSEEARAVNPSGKIPSLREGDMVITDSTAIMTYLADKHGGLTAPAGTLARARQDAMTHRILDEIDSVLWAAAMHSFILPEERRVPQVKDTLKWAFEMTAAGIGEALETPFLMGEEMRIPDILLTHCLRWAEIANFPDPGERLTDYKDRMEARPAFQKVVALP